MVQSIVYFFYKLPIFTFIRCIILNSSFAYHMKMRFNNYSLDCSMIALQQMSFESYYNIQNSQI